jgi:hypothetical protein
MWRLLVRSRTRHRTGGRIEFLMLKLILRWMVSGGVSLLVFGLGWHHQSAKAGFQQLFV